MDKETLYQSEVESATGDGSLIDCVYYLKVIVKVSSELKHPHLKFTYVSTNQFYSIGVDEYDVM